MPKAANPATQGVVSAALADTDAISAPLVSYLKRLRDLDETASGLTASIKRAVDAKLEEAREGKDDGKRARGETAERRFQEDSNHGIEVMTARCVSVCDEKVATEARRYFPLAALTTSEAAR